MRYEIFEFEDRSENKKLKERQLREDFNKFIKVRFLR